MKTEYINDIEIKYSSSTIDEYNKIKKYIETNPVFFQTILPKKINLDYEEEGYGYLNDIDAYIEETIETMLSMQLYDDIMTNKLEIEARFYYSLLKNEYDKHNIFPNILEEKNDENYIATMLALTIIKDKDKLINFIKTMDKQTKTELFLQAREDCRTIVFNYILSGFDEALSSYDDSLIEKFNSLSNELNKKYFENLTPETQSEILLFGEIIPEGILKKNRFSKLSLNKLMLTFVSFLEDFEKNYEWASEFIKLLRTNNIKFINSEKPEEENDSFIYDDTLVIFCNGTTNDLRVLAHEFAHFMAHKLNGDNEYDRVLGELPSIYLENEIVNYLESTGNYSEEEIAELRKIRETEMQEVFINSYYNLIRYFTFFKEHGYIDENVIKQYIQNDAEQIEDSFLQLSEPAPVGYEGYREDSLRQIQYILANDECLHELATDVIDNDIILLLKNGPDAIIANIYLVGEYIVRQFDDVPEADRKIIMQYIIRYLNEFDIQKIFNMIEQEKKCYVKTAS